MHESPPSPNGVGASVHMILPYRNTIYDSFASFAPCASTVWNVFRSAIPGQDPYGFAAPKNGTLFVVMTNAHFKSVDDPGKASRRLVDT